MAIKTNTGFEIGSIVPIDSRITLTSAEMLAVNDNTQPDKYFAINQDNGKLYLYDKSAEPNAATGKFSLLEGGEGAKIWEGTKAEYELEKDTIEPGTLIVITDEDGQASSIFYDCTQEEYDALPDDKLTNGIAYMISEEGSTTVKLVRNGKEISGGGDAVIKVRKIPETFENKVYVKESKEAGHFAGDIEIQFTPFDDPIYKTTEVPDYSKDEQALLNFFDKYDISFEKEVHIGESTDSYIRYTITDFDGTFLFYQHYTREGEGIIKEIEAIEFRYNYLELYWDWRMVISAGNSYARTDAKYQFYREYDVPTTESQAFASNVELATKEYVDTHGAVIDDTKTTAENVWSAKKVQDEFGARSGTRTILPLLNFQGPFLPKVKNIGAIKHTYTYIDGTTTYSGTCTIKVQGNSTAGASYRKKNYTIKFDKKLDFGWGPQSKYVIKANWIDYTQSRNVCTSRIYKQMTEARADLENYPEEFKASPTLGTIDGFPIKVSHNGTYQGRYTLNIPKDAWTYGLDSSNENHGFFMGDSYREACLFRDDNCLWNDYDWTSELQDEAPAAIKEKWQDVIRFVKDSTDEEFKEHLSDYFYVDSVLDYWILVQCAALGDGLAKNQGYITYDGGNKWIAIAYDMDMSWGLYWDGSYNHLGAANVARKNYEDMATWAAGTTTQYDKYGEPVTYERGTSGNLLYLRIEKNFKNELRERYRELRQNVLSTGNIISLFDDFCSIMPEDLNKLDYAPDTGDGTFNTMPNTPDNPGEFESVGYNYCCIEQLREYIRLRMENRDKWLYKVPDTLGEKLTSADQIIDGHYYAFQQTASGAFFNADGNKSCLNFTDNDMQYTGVATFKAHVLEDGTIQFESNEINSRWITYSGKVYQYGTKTDKTKAFNFDELILTSGLTPTTYHYDYGYNGKEAFRFYAEMNHNRRETISDYTSPIINITEYMYWDRIAEDHETRPSWSYWWDNNVSRAYKPYSEPFGYDGFVCWHSGELDSLNCWWNVYEVNVTN